MQKNVKKFRGHRRCPFPSRVSPLNGDTVTSKYRRSRTVFTLFCRAKTPYSLLAQQPFMYKHNTSVGLIISTFKKSAKKCKKVAKKFGKHEIFIVSLRRILKERAGESRNSRPCSMVGTTLPTIPSVRIAKSRQFSMLIRIARTSYGDVRDGRVVESGYP